jgi:hypothetical protein
MQTQVTAETDAMARQVRQLLDFYLTGIAEDLHRIDITVRSLDDPLGRRLFHCHLRAAPWRGQPLEIDEQQADLVLAVTRVLDRCSRTLRRRQYRQRLQRSA